VWRQARGQIVRQPVQAVLGCEVRGQIPVQPGIARHIAAHAAVDRCNVDHAAPAALDHSRNKQLAQPKRRVEIQRQHFPPFIERNRFPRLDLSAASVVDQDIDAPGCMLESLHVVFDRHICDNNRDIPPECAQLDCTRLKRLAAPAANYEIGAGFGQAMSHLSV
jgi:hypothetical protein